MSETSLWPVSPDTTALLVKHDTFAPVISQTSHNQVRHVAVVWTLRSMSQNLTILNISVFSVLTLLAHVFSING